jgi:hypothetical protein
MKNLREIFEGEKEAPEPAREEDIARLERYARGLNSRIGAMRKAGVHISPSALHLMGELHAWVLMAHGLHMKREGSSARAIRHAMECCKRLDDATRP